MDNISVALIVKNEEAVLGRCLESIKDLADEIIIVDTGSGDKTKIIAKQYGAKIYDFKWIDDFSSARNYSFSKCTKTWVLWLDADDVLREEDKVKIKQLDVSNTDMVLCRYEYAHDERDQVILSLYRERIIRRSLNVKWISPIHEYLPLCGRQFKSDISIHHYKKAGSSDRNLKILERIVDKNSDSRNVYYLGKEYFDCGKHEQAKPYLEKFIESDGFWEDRYQANFMLAQIYFDKPDKCKFHLFKCMDLEERRAEAYYLMGQFFMAHNNNEKAIHWFTICLNIRFPKDLLGSILMEYYTWKPAISLVVCYNSFGEIEKAKHYNDMVLKYQPNNPMALNNKTLLEQAINRKRDGQGKRLNLGCGGKPEAGYVNVDIFKGEFVDEVFSMDKIPYTDGTISAIFSEHAIEHLGLESVRIAIKEWFRVLQHGGELLLKLPDLEGCCKAYLQAPILAKSYFETKAWYKNTIYGMQHSLSGEQDEFQIHRSGFSKQEMIIILEEIGFLIDYAGEYDGYGTPSISFRAIKPASNIKIGWISSYNPIAAQTRIRVLNIDRWLRSVGYKSKLITYNQAVQENYDIVIVGKNFDENHYLNIKMLKRRGVTVYCDLCEDIMQFPWVKEILELCDLVICCSKELENRVRIINPKTTVIEDAYEI